MRRIQIKLVGFLVSALAVALILAFIFHSSENTVHVQVVDARSGNAISNINVDLLQLIPRTRPVRYFLRIIGRQSDVRSIASEFKSKTGTMNLHYVTSAVFTAPGYYGAELVHEHELEYTLVLAGSNGTRDVSFSATNTVKVPLEPKNSLLK